jgi:hypothetical protein
MAVRRTTLAGKLEPRFHSLSPLLISIITLSDSSLETQTRVGLSHLTSRTPCESSQFCPRTFFRPAELFKAFLAMEMRGKLTPSRTTFSGKWEPVVKCFSHLNFEHAVLRGTWHASQRSCFQEEWSCVPFCNIIWIFLTPVSQDGQHISNSWS